MPPNGITIAGDLDPQQNDWYKKYKGQENAPKPDDMLLNTDPEPELKTGFVSIFNGMDLTGWTSKGGTAKYTAKDGILTGTCVLDSDSTYLCTEKVDYNDFIFTCDMKWDVKGNVAKSWVNGVPAAHWVDKGTYTKGAFGLQIHKGKEGTVLWRDLRVKELKP